MSINKNKHKELGIANKVSVKPKSVGNNKVVDGINKQQLSLMRHDMNSLRVAFQNAEHIQYPSRLRLYEIYHEIKRDAQVASLLQSRKIKALGKDFQLVGKNGKVTKATEEATEVLKSTWFQKIMELAWEAIPYGFSLIQLGDIVDNKFKTIDLVPRQNVRPEESLVIPYPGAIQGISYEDNPWVLPCGDPKSLGLLANVAKIAIYKSHAQASEAKAVDLFGAPYRYVVMDMSDDERVEDAMQMLAEQGTSGYGVFDEGMELKILEVKASGGDMHSKFIRDLDEDISKVLFGQTMLSDDGSSRSQSEVHERLANDYTLWDAQFLASTINDAILPRLIELGFPFKDMRFEFLKGENIKQLFEMTIKAMNTPNLNGVDMKWFSEKFGIEFNKKDKKDESTAVATEDAESSAKDEE